MVVAEVRERLVVNKQAAQKIDMERFNVKKLNEGDVNSIRLQSETSLQLWKT
jgi:DNA-binding Xre family transcriptional regulator